MGVLGVILLFTVLSVAGIDIFISKAYEAKIYTDSSSIPARDVALVLGTGKYTANGMQNAFYLNRLKAAAELFKAGKVKGILVSGDNSRRSYDESTDMEKDLIKLGVPASAITKDYAGFRTLDSIVRAGKIFGVNDYIIISQRFHCERALYIASHCGHSPLAFCAKDVGGHSGEKVRIREILARTKAFMDIFVLRTSPKFLGKQEELNLCDNTQSKTYQ